MKFEDLQRANATIKTTNIKGKDYAEVNQRIKAFRMIFPDGFITTEIVSIENGMCIMRATVGTETATGTIVLGTGTAYERENASTINKTSYIENCETSAVGRALGMAGFGIDVSVASAEEVKNAIAQQEAQSEPEQQKAQPQQEPQAQQAPATIDETKIAALTAKMQEHGVPTEKILKLYKIQSLTDMTIKMFMQAMEKMAKIKEMNI